MDSLFNPLATIKIFSPPIFPNRVTRCISIRQILLSKSAQVKTNLTIKIGHREVVSLCPVAVKLRGGVREGEFRLAAEWAKEVLILSFL